MRGVIESKKRTCSMRVKVFYHSHSLTHSHTHTHPHLRHVGIECGGASRIRFRPCRGGWSRWMASTRTHTDQPGVPSADGTPKA